MKEKKAALAAREKKTISTEGLTARRVDTAV
jgi:hypothetical protein